MFTLSREETLSYYGDEAISSSKRRKKKKARVLTEISDKPSALRYLLNCHVGDEKIVDYSAVLEDKSILYVFVAKEDFARRIQFLDSWVVSSKELFGK